MFLKELDLASLSKDFFKKIILSGVLKLHFFFNVGLLCVVAHTIEHTHKFVRIYAYHTQIFLNGQLLYC